MSGDKDGNVKTQGADENELWKGEKNSRINGAIGFGFLEKIILADKNNIM